MRGVGHVVAVADVAHLQTLSTALCSRTVIRSAQHLAGVAEIRQAVDHRMLAWAARSPPPPGQGADHNAVTVPQQHRAVSSTGSPFARSGSPCWEEQGVAAQLVHPGLKGDAGAVEFFSKIMARVLPFSLSWAMPCFWLNFSWSAVFRIFKISSLDRSSSFPSVFFHLRSPFLSIPLNGSAWCRCPRRTAAPTGWRGTLPSSRVADRTPERTASTLQFAFSAISGGITPLRIMAGTWDSPSSGMGPRGPPDPAGAWCSPPGGSQLFRLQRHRQPGGSEAGADAVHCLAAVRALATAATGV